MKTRVITISREFGSGGRLIAQRVATRLGWKIYDRNLIEKIAEKSGLAKEFIEEKGESAAAGQHLAYSVPAGFGSFLTGQSVFDKLYVMQYNIIKEIADEAPCVIVGRCADYILRDRTDCFRVFVHADIDYRIKQVSDTYKELYNVEAKDMRKFLEGLDKKRKLYYRYNTDRVWDDVRNYELCLKSSSMSLDECATVIISCIES
ncbi:MAG: cytidylate kinase-like family protein [Treponema sp.]|nr:cytidylate kinase-like family protein [Treponema sp.]